MTSTTTTTTSSHQDMVQELNDSNFAPEVVEKAIANKTLPLNYKAIPTLPHTLERHLNELGWRWNPSTKIYPCPHVPILPKYRILRNLYFYGDTCQSILDLHEYQPEDPSITTYYQNYLKLYGEVKDNKFTLEELQLLFPSDAAYTYIEPLEGINPFVNDKNIILNFLDIFSNHFLTELVISIITVAVKLYVVSLFGATITTITVPAVVTAIVNAFASTFIHYIAKLLISIVIRIPIISHFVRGVTHLLDTYFPPPQHKDGIIYTIIYHIVQIIVQMVKMGAQLSMQIVPNLLLSNGLPALISGIDMKEINLPFPKPDIMTANFDDLWPFFTNSVNQILVTDQLQSYVFGTLHITKESVRGQFLGKVIHRFSSIPYIYRIVIEVLKTQQNIVPTV